MIVLKYMLNPDELHSMQRLLHQDSMTQSKLKKMYNHLNNIGDTSDGDTII